MAEALRCVRRIGYTRWNRDCALQLEGRSDPSRVGSLHVTRDFLFVEMYRRASRAERRARRNMLHDGSSDV